MTLVTSLVNWFCTVRSWSPVRVSQTLMHVVGPAGDEHPAVGPPGDAQHVVRVALERADELAVGHVPDLDEPVGRAAGELLAVGREVEAVDRVAVRLLEGQHELAVRHVEQILISPLRRRLAAADREQLAVRREVEGRDAIDAASSAMSGVPIVRSSFHSVAKSHIAPVLLAAPVIALPSVVKATTFSAAVRAAIDLDGRARFAVPGVQELVVADGDERSRRPARRRRS